MSAVSHLKVTIWKVILRQLCGNNCREKQHNVHVSGYNACNSYALYDSYFIIIIYD